MWIVWLNRTIYLLVGLLIGVMAGVILSYLMDLAAENRKIDENNRLAAVERSREEVKDE